MLGGTDGPNARALRAPPAGGMLGHMADVTGILSAIERGDLQAAGQLLPLVYEELRQLAAARLAGWGLLYATLGAFWWPALVIGLVALPAARHRARLAVAVYAELAEAAVDLYGRDLAVQLGLPCPDRLTREIGEQITAIVRKDDVVPRARRPRDASPRP